MAKRIVYIQFTNPGAYPPLCHGAQILAENNWEVLFLGLHYHDTENLKLPDHPAIKAKWMTCRSPGFIQKLAYIYFIFWCLYHVIRFGPNWVYASEPLSCPAAWIIQRFYPVRVLYHEHDSPQGNAEKTLISGFRIKVSKLAELCVLPNEQRLQEFVKTTARTGPTLCIWNTPPKHEVVLKSAQRDNTFIRLIYHGSINSNRLPPSMITALSLDPKLQLHVIGYETAGSTGYLKSLVQKAHELGCDKRLILHGTVLRHQMLELEASSHIGIAFMPVNTEDINMKWMVGASNKVFEYMACGLPVLISNIPEWIESFERPGYGISCQPEDPLSILKAIKTITENSETFRSIGERNRNKILDDWNYEMSFTPVLKVLSQ